MIESMSPYLLFVIGLVVLIGSAELLIKNAVTLASTIGRSRLLIGMTVAALGTSAPELAIGVVGILEGTADVGVGNIVGSNIFNILIVLGIGALIAPLAVNRKTILRDIPILLGVYLLFFLMVLNGYLGIIESILLLIILAGYIFYLSRVSSERSESMMPEIGETEKAPLSRMALIGRLTLIVVSVALLAGGSHLMVTGVVAIAKSYGVSELTIGLTVVAAGTSLPEAATTLAAIRKGEHDLAIGNIMGSCLFNIIAVPALMSLITLSPLAVADDAFFTDLPVMILALIACLPIFFSGHRISRPEGFLFLVYYVCYALILYLRASDDSFLADYKTLFWVLVVSMFVITFGIITTRAVTYARRLNRNGK